MDKLPLSLRLGLIASTLIGTFLFFFMKPVITQDPSYHMFADQRVMMGIPHAFDVLSNIFFLIVGYLGVMEVVGKKLLLTRKSWIWFFLSIVLIAPGSAYYHWDPNNETLVWDRLPMSMGFMALYVALLAEHVHLKFEKLLPMALFTGIISVIVWVVTTDLRFYFWVQFSSFVTIPIILIFFSSRYTHKIWFLYTLILYGLAKFTEVKDHEIFLGTNQLISGHTLKHILAAVGLAALWWMVRVRKEKALETVPHGIVANAPGKL
jgi:hypothetical protein